MLELLQRHAPLCCALLLLWSAQSLVSEDVYVAADVEAPLPVFAEEHLAVRAAGRGAQPLSDPFRHVIELEPEPLPPEPEPEPEPLADATLDDAARDDAPPEPEAELQVRLESLLDTGDARSSARLNGQLLRLGEPLLGWLPDAEAPRLAAVQGTRVVLRFNGVDHILDFNGRSSAFLTRRPGTAPRDPRPPVASPASTSPERRP